MSNLDREDALDRALSGQSQQERLIDSAAAAICGQAYELMLSHTISGKWSDSVLPIKAEHDMLLEMAGELKSLKASSPEISDNSGSDSEKPNSSEAVAWSWENHGRQVTVDKAFADELISDGEIVRPLIFGDTHPASSAPDEEYLRALQDACDIIISDANTEQNYGSLCRIGSVLAKLKATPTKADEWIKCSEQRPNVLDVWIKMTDGSVVACWSQLDGDFYWNGGGSESYILENTVTHWKPRQQEQGE